MESRDGNAFRSLPKEKRLRKAALPHSAKNFQGSTDLLAAALQAMDGLQGSSVSL